MSCLPPPPFNIVLLKTVQDCAFYQLPVKQKTNPVQCKFVMYMVTGPVPSRIPAHIFMNKPNLIEHGINSTSSYLMKRPLGNARSFTRPLKSHKHGP